MITVLFILRLLNVSVKIEKKKISGLAEEAGPGVQRDAHAADSAVQGRLGQVPLLHHRRPDGALNRAAAAFFCWSININK